MTEAGDVLKAQPVRLSESFKKNSPTMAESKCPNIHGQGGCRKV